MSDKDASLLWNPLMYILYRIIGIGLIESWWCKTIISDYFGARNAVKVQWEGGYAYIQIQILSKCCRFIKVNFVARVCDTVTLSGDPVFFMGRTWFPIPPPPLPQGSSDNLIVMASCPMFVVPITNTPQPHLPPPINLTLIRCDCCLIVFKSILF